jgi:hypothetical protein
MKSVLEKTMLAGVLVLAVVSLAATNTPAPVAATNADFVDVEAVAAENPQVKQLTDALQKEGIKTDDLMNENFLFASLFWGSIAGGYCIYGWKQRSGFPLAGGVAMTAVSFFITSWFWMSLACIALMVAVWQMVKRWG